MIEGSRGIYVVLKVLANEKATELKQLASKVGLNVGIAIGDRDGETGMVDESDILVCNCEKLDSLRTRSELMM